VFHKSKFKTNTNKSSKFETFVKESNIKIFCWKYFFWRRKSCIWFL